jgi:predicted flap endonuclease-1-like 5' DNA nuclease
LQVSRPLPVNSEARKRLEKRALNETGITNFNQVAALVEAVAIHAALENGKSGDVDTAEALFAQAQTISEALRKLHELVQTLA